MTFKEAERPDEQARQTKSPHPRPQPPRFKLLEKEDGVHQIHLEDKDEEAAVAKLNACLGTENWDFISGIIKHLANLSGRNGEIDADDLNFLLSVVSDIEPRDQVDTMRTAQMAAVHTATMTFANRLKQVVTIEQQDSAEKAFNKLTRTFTSQMEALRKYRHGGEQKVTVQHVNVNDGGQAVVGNVSTKSRG
jgi:hypothetical protein